MPAFIPVSRRARASWLDLRLVVGVVLVVASVAGVWLVVASARETSPVLAAAHTIVPGQVVTAADVVAVEANLGTQAGEYLSPADLDDGLVAVRTVLAGEFLAGGAVGSMDDIDTTTVVVRSALDVPADIAAGATVELWAVPPAERDERSAPTVIVPRAVVGQIGDDTGVVRDSGAVLELVVPRDAVGIVLEHVANGSALSAVPVSVPNAAGEPLS